MRKKVINLVGEELAAELSKFSNEDILRLAHLEGLSAAEIREKIRQYPTLYPASFKLRLRDAGYVKRGADPIVLKSSILRLIEAATKVSVAARPKTRPKDIALLLGE